VATLEDDTRVAYAVGNKEVDYEIHLGAAYVQIGNVFYNAIVDMEDPLGDKLKYLYLKNKDVRVFRIM